MPAGAPLRRFLPFSPWRAPARLRLKSQKSLGNPSLAGGKQFCRAEMCPDKERPVGNTCRISKGLDAVWPHFCPSKPCLPSSTDGKVRRHDFKSSASQIVHLTDPRHLVVGFQLLRYALRRSHLIYQLLEYFLSLPVHIRTMAVSFTACQQIDIE